ncbi:MAG: formylglycine-generating enzyme family protein [Verrucomicrobiota bacterium]
MKPSPTHLLACVCPSPVNRVRKARVSHPFTGCAQASLALIVGLVSLGQAQPVKAPLLEWQITAGGSGDDSVYWMQQTQDGGYVVGGPSNSNASGMRAGSRTAPNFGGYDYWVVRLDPQGAELWDKAFGGLGDDKLFVVLEASDGGFLLGGRSNSGKQGNKETPGFGGYDYWVVRLNAAGDKLWDKTYGGTDEDRLVAVAPASDGGFLLGGRSRSPVGGNRTAEPLGGYDFWVVRLDAQGNKLWDKAFGGSADETLWALAGTPDGGWILAGSSASDIEGTKTSPNYGDLDAWVVRLDKEGNQLWDSSFGGGGTEEAMSVQTTPDGGCVLCAYTNSGASGNKHSPNFGDFDGWVVRLDAQGKLVWEKDFGGLGYDELNCVRILPDGGYIVAGDSTSGLGPGKASPQLGGQDGWIVRLNPQGERLWEWSLGGGGTELVFVLQLTTDQGFIVAGQSDSTASASKGGFNYGGNDFWVVKLGPEAGPHLALAQPPPDLKLAFQGQVGRLYTLESITSLGTTNAWTALTNLALVANPTVVSDPTASLAAQRFYRLAVTSFSNMVWIAPGTFIMGSPTNEAGHETLESPQTQVTLSRGFYLGKYEVTQGEYLAVVGANPSQFTGDLNRPVEEVSWRDATNYCARLTERERAAGRIPADYGYRLPTEAEWEFTCRAGSLLPYGIDYTSGAVESLYDYAWVFVNSSSTTHRVGAKRPNPWGLYDMHGNVLEFCLDRFGDYPGGSVVDLLGPSAGTNIVARGGCWGTYAVESRSAVRYPGDLTDHLNITGFRVVLAPGRP